MRRLGPHRPPPESSAYQGHSFSSTPSPSRSISASIEKSTRFMRASRSFCRLMSEYADAICPMMVATAATEMTMKIEAKTLVYHFLIG